MKTINTETLYNNLADDYNLEPIVNETQCAGCNHCFDDIIDIFGEYLCDNCIDYLLKNDVNYFRSLLQRINKVNKYDVDYLLERLDKINKGGK